MSEQAADREPSPSVLAYTSRDKARDLLRRAFTRRRARLVIVKSLDAVKAAVIGKIKGLDHPVGLALTAELENQTKAIIAEQAKDTPPAPPQG